MESYEYDVSLSFSGSQRDYVRAVATALRQFGPRLFYDEDFEIEMWGTDLNEYLRQVYGRSIRFIVMFVSEAYAAAAFPTVERRGSFAAEMHRGATVLPVRFDDVDLPGLGENIAYQDARRVTPEQLAAAIAMKLETAGVSLRRPTVSTYSPAPRARSTAPLTVRVTNSTGEPIGDLLVAAAQDNGVVAKGDLVANGLYTIDVPTGRLVRLWVAHPNYRALLVERCDSSEDVDAVLGEAAGTGSIIFYGSTGYLPTVKGRFDLHVEASDSGYVYIDNAAVNGAPARPADYTFGEPLEVEDPDGSVTVVTILDSTGNGALVEYEAPPDA
jgi:hypothetical protein